ncbi:transposase [Nonomuraea sp. NPDC003754]
MKNYPPRFKKDAVALYESRPGATIAGIVADLGISSETLRNRTRAARKGRGESARPDPRSRREDSSGRASLETVEAENTGEAHIPGCRHRHPTAPNRNRTHLTW